MGAHTSHDHSRHDHGEASGADHDHGPQGDAPDDHSAHDHTGHDHTGHDHAGHDHAGHGGLGGHSHAPTSFGTTVVLALRTDHGIGHATMQVETDDATTCALAPDHVV